MVGLRKQQKIYALMESHGLEHLPSLWSKQRAWTAAWIGDTAEARNLRERWGNDGKRYRTRFRPDEEDLLRILTHGMHYFTVLQTQMFRRAKHDALLQTGELALGSLVQGLIAGEASTEYQFASIDLEGNNIKGITEFGITKLDASKLAPEQTPMDSLQSQNYILRSQGRHKYCFGTSTRLSSEILPRTMLKELEVSPGQRLILIGHGIHGDLRSMERLGLDLGRDIPQLAGVVDTMIMAKKILGRGSNLEDLLKARDIRIPFHRGHLHCAGNDGRYTMHAMLALLHLQKARQTTSHQVFERLEGLLMAARQPGPDRGPRTESAESQLEEYMDCGLFVEN